MNNELQLADTSNQFMVHRDAPTRRVVIGTIGGVITDAEALNLAAWIVALVDPEQKDFNRLLAAVKKT